MRSWQNSRILTGLLLGLIFGLLGCGPTSGGVPGNTGFDLVPTATPAAVATATGSAATPSTTPVVDMGVSVFVGSHSFLIKPGTVMQFNDDSDGGGLHLLYTGQNGQFTAEPGAPDALNNATGVSIKGGQSLSYAFTTAGTYSITCAYHPSMVIQITVAP